MVNGNYKIVNGNHNGHNNDLFKHKILCSKCDTEMKNDQTLKNGFVMRIKICPRCHDKIFHPTDEHEYNRFINLKNKEFNVKMRLVGNSYAVSIPKEVVDFMREQEKMMNDMVRLCFEDFNRLSLNFGLTNNKIKTKYGRTKALLEKDPGEKLGLF